MKYIPILLLTLSNYLYCQQPISEGQPASYPGGTSAFIEYVQSQLAPRWENAHFFSSGTVNTSFVVMEDGTVGNVTIVEGVDGYTDSLLKHIVEQSPNWSPAVLEGKPVKFTMNLPLKFKRGKNYRAKKIKHLYSESYILSHPKKWRATQTTKQLKLDNKAFGRSGTIFFYELLDLEPIDVRKEKYESTGFVFEEQPQQISVNGYPTLVWDGRFKLNARLEQLTTPMLSHLFEISGCDKRYAVLIFYFEEDKIWVQDKIAFILESFECK